MPQTFTRKEYNKEIFTKLHEEKSIFSKIEFYDCTFTSCYFLECTFEKCIFTNCTFENCDISAIKVFNSKFVDVVFKDSKVIGVDWTKAGGLGSKLPLSLQFFNTIINYSSFYGLTLPHFVLTKSTAREVDFGSAKMSEANMQGTDFTESKFHNCYLYKADFQGATNYLIDPSANYVKKAKFSLPEAISLLRGFEVEIT